MNITDEEFEEYFGKKYNLEEELKKRGWKFESENEEKHITYEKGYLFRIYYDGNLIDENGFIDEISIFNIHGDFIYNGYQPKTDEELDYLLLEYCNQS